MNLKLTSVRQIFAKCVIDFPNVMIQTALLELKSVLYTACTENTG